MITNIQSLKKYCTDYKNIENYEEALKSPLKYDLHHRLEISENKSRKQLIAENLYYGRPPEELVFLEHREHCRLHKEGENNSRYWKGKNLSAETRQKISESKKGKQNALGHHCSAETRAKLSEAKKGRHWHLENGHRVLTD
jgi:hypothetical protein